MEWRFWRNLRKASRIWRCAVKIVVAQAFPHFFECLKALTVKSYPRSRKRPVTVLTDIHDDDVAVIIIEKTWGVLRVQ